MGKRRIIVSEKPHMKSKQAAADLDAIIDMLEATNDAKWTPYIEKLARKANLWWPKEGPPVVPAQAQMQLEP